IVLQSFRRKILEVYEDFILSYSTDVLPDQDRHSKVLKSFLHWSSTQKINQCATALLQKQELDEMLHLHELNAVRTSLLLVICSVMLHLEDERLKLPLVAEKDGTPVFKFPRWRLKGKPIPEVVEAYKAVGAELNVMPFCSQFIPMNVIDFPKNGSIIYHPSILPRHRGASAINWTLIEGDKKAGFSIFWADDGLDTGPILLQKECPVEANDTVDTLYNRFLYPEGVKAMVEAVQLIADGKAPKIPQPEEGASYEGIQKKSNAKVNMAQPAEAIHNWIRGHDKVPGAWVLIDGKVCLFKSHFHNYGYF
ncbi:hypothetical protein DNTS_011096, partial [Danionella cerebrum]